MPSIHLGRRKQDERTLVLVFGSDKLTVDPRWACSGLLTDPVLSWVVRYPRRGFKFGLDKSVLGRQELSLILRCECYIHRAVSLQGRSLGEGTTQQCSTAWELVRNASSWAHCRPPNHNRGGAKPSLLSWALQLILWCESYWDGEPCWGAGMSVGEWPWSWHVRGWSGPRSPCPQVKAGTGAWGQVYLIALMWSERAQEPSVIRDTVPWLPFGAVAWPQALHASQASQLSEV